MARRVLGAFAVTATAALATLAMATPASAHNPSSKAECVDGKAVLTVRMVAYQGTNSLVIRDGDTVLHDLKFKANFPEKNEPDFKEGKKYVFDGTVAHKFNVKVVPSDGQGKWNETHSLDACVTKPPTKTEETKPTTTTTTPVATSPEVPSSSEVPPSTTPAAPGGSNPEPPLAATGASPTGLLLAGLGLVGAGAGTLLFLRRRRSA